MAGVVAAQVSGAVLPTPDGLSALRVESRVRAKDREDAIGSREDVRVATVSARVREHAVALLREEALGELHLRERERPHRPASARRARRLGDAWSAGQCFEPRQ